MRLPRALSAVWLVGLAAAAHAQARYDIFLDDKKFGTGSLTQMVSKEGIKTVKLILNLRVDGGEIRVTNESQYGPTGRPIRKYLETVAVGTNQRRQIVATFTPGGAFVVDERSGDRRTAQRPVPDGQGIEDAAEFWFIRGIPKPGEEVKALRFDLEKLEWRMQTSSYVGPADVQLGRRTLKGHELTVDGRTIYVDDKGLPLLMEVGNLRLVRS
ncbi:MAG TPA: hypothetical protein VM328_03970 [Fimbriimonadaceae bacterium]|nr:hypothetical protein [Fimbriimonadaceae bacterium]